MLIAIHKRATWARFVAEDRRAHAAADPVPSRNPWDPTGGVFIHHRGAAQVIGGELETEQDCLEDIAGVYEDHTNDPKEFNGDVAYNYFVCQHGNVYEGRGYERGEANHAGTVDGIGRNAGFYSICGLLRSDQLATEAMLRSMRALIQHLREQAPRRAGTRIYPHAFGYPETECPGNLTMYAQPGAAIDPSAPWTGLADIYIFEGQKHCNATYRDAPGYLACPQDGRTGWSTVLSLTQGLQHELGISPTVRSFGPATMAAVKRRNTLPGGERNANLVRIYNAALWCKGYWTSTRQAIWSDDSEAALSRLYTDAGLSYSAHSYKMWPHVAKALLRMDQFRLVRPGDINVQRVQQRLNARYVAEIGIPAMSLVPCDGIYSRDVQQGFMMALQYELGIPLDAINGNFGPGTQAALRTRGAERPSGDLRYLFRAACYFNSPVIVELSSRQAPLMYLPEDISTDAETETHLEWLRAFQRFSQLPVTGTNDYATWAQLLVSSGDTSRPATGCDCITEITRERAQQLIAAGYRIVGRYLDEHLPPSDPAYLGKALKPGEPQTILSAGLRFIPIFQYNGTQLANFTYTKGYDQAKNAHQKALEHRIPPKTCIYFAVDYDALDVDIDSHIHPYFLGVRAALAELGDRYSFGVYGSRNVCTRVSMEAGARWSLVSGMSWGYSGNLGFPLPANWSFNQIREYEFRPGWGLDHDVWREGADPGVAALVPA